MKISARNQLDGTVVEVKKGRHHRPCPGRAGRRSGRHRGDHQRIRRRAGPGPRQDRQGGDQVQRRDDRDGLTLFAMRPDRRVPAPRLGGPRAGRAARAEPPRDDAGRALDTLKTARYPGVPAGPPAAIMLYTLAPELLLGWPRAIRPAEKPYLLPRAADCRRSAGLTGRGNTANLESVPGAKPDLILDVGSTAETYRSLADRVQGQTGIPYALLDGASRRRARHLSQPRTADRARRRPLAALARASWRRCASASRRCRRRSAPGSTSPGGPRGLETARAGSINVEALALMGAANVAGPGGGLAQVSPEDVVAWAPDIVIALDPVFAAAARQDPLWQATPAVRANRLHVSPSLPFAGRFPTLGQPAGRPVGGSARSLTRRSSRRTSAASPAISTAGSTTSTRTIRPSTACWREPRERRGTGGGAGPPARRAWLALVSPWCWPPPSPSGSGATRSRSSTSPGCSPAALNGHSRRTWRRRSRRWCGRSRAPHRRRDPDPARRLSVAATAFQGLFRNPLVFPDILGASFGGGARRRRGHLALPRGAGDRGHGLRGRAPGGGLRLRARARPFGARSGLWSWCSPGSSSARSSAPGSG